LNSFSLSDGTSAQTIKSPAPFFVVMWRSSSLAGIIALAGVLS